jgi:hypothetical protein
MKLFKPSSQKQEDLNLLKISEPTISSSIEKNLFCTIKFVMEP